MTKFKDMAGRLVTKSSVKLQKAKAMARKGASICSICAVQIHKHVVKRRNYNIQVIIVDE
jgi:hypothetical protein